MDILQQILDSFAYQVPNSRFLWLMVIAIPVMALFSAIATAISSALESGERKKELSRLVHKTLIEQMKHDEELDAKSRRVTGQ
ncbi:MAG: hypothetical protein PHY09_02585 [Desulfuromonadaceae bacterium]|nr:hypothetical protein [Desulfuromonadaceae bacterium]MDD5105513.1 hypothetical protein [Desulfuromonadaceae bacterium]